MADSVVATMTGAADVRSVLVTADTVGGVWTYTMELARELARRGVRVTIATTGALPSAEQRAQVAALRGVTLHARAYRLEWMTEPWHDIERAGEWLLGLERGLAPDVVHLNQFAFGALPFAAPTLLVAHSCVCSWWEAVHGEPAPPTWHRYRETVAAGLAGAGLVAAPTRAMLQCLGRSYGFHGERVVLPNGRDPGPFHPADVRAPVVLAAGRLWDAAKNLAALDAVAPALPWPVRVAGPTKHPDGGTIAAANVTLLGVLPQAELARELAAASIFAAPARYEPFGLAVLEAALSGCALVLGDVASLREIWGHAALYVPPDDHGALRAAITGLVNDTPRRLALARAAHTRALEYSAGTLAHACLAVYAQLLGRSAAAPAPHPVAPGEEVVCGS